MMSVYNTLDQLAQELVGDNKSPNTYFVTQDGHVLTVTTDRRTAYLHWRQLAALRPRRACALEDREHGVLASLEARDGESGGRLELQDNYAEMTGDHGIEPWQVSHLIDYARSEEQPSPDADQVRQTTCSCCGLDIEGVWPFPRGQWHDRGGETNCPNSQAAHIPVSER